MPSRQRDQDLIARSDVTVWLAVVAIHLDAPQLARLLRLGAGFEDARDVEPNVEADGEFVGHFRGGSRIRDPGARPATHPPAP